MFEKNQISTDIFDNIYPPFPDVQPIAGERSTNITYGGGHPAALSHIISRGVLWGEVLPIWVVPASNSGTSSTSSERV